MGKIIKNGIPYGGTSTSAGNISYNNTGSGLISATVQNAITELKSLFDNSEHIRMIVVEELPSIESAEDNVVYLIDEDSSGVYEEYIVAEVEGVRQFIKIGETDIDLSSYLQQVTTLPAPSSANVGKIYQYVGETTADYTHSFIYECISDGEDPAIYSWIEVLDSVGRPELDAEGNILGEYFNKYEDTIDSETSEVTTPRNHANGAFSHAEGYGNNFANGAGSHVEGYSNTVTSSGSFNHVEGMSNYSDTHASHVEGNGNKSSGGGSAAFSHAEGNGNITYTYASHIEGEGNYSGQFTNYPNTSTYSKSVQVNSLPTSDIATDTVYITHNNASDSGLVANTYDGTNWTSVNLVPSVNYRGHTEGQKNINAGRESTHVEGSNNIALDGNQYSHVEGLGNTIGAGGFAVHIEGQANATKDGVSRVHVEGYQNLIDGGNQQTHVEGTSNSVGGGVQHTHVEGIGNTIGGGVQKSHIEGSNNNVDSGVNYVHVEGNNNTVNPGADYNHVEGEGNSTGGGSTRNHIEGANNTAGSATVYSHIEGKGHTLGAALNSTHVEGLSNAVSDRIESSHIEGRLNTIVGTNSGSTVSVHVEGQSNNASRQDYGHIEGYGNTAKTAALDSGYSAYENHVEGRSNTLTGGNATHVEGENNSITLSDSSSDNHIEGRGNSMYGTSSTSMNATANHLEGMENTITGITSARYSHLEGYGNHIYGGDGQFVHIEGTTNIARGSRQHIEGQGNVAAYEGDGSHTEGRSNKNFSEQGHAEGYSNLVTGDYNHIEGNYNTIGAASDLTITQDGGNNNHVEGSSNHLSNGTSSHIEGEYNTVNGSSNTAIHVGGQSNTVEGSAIAAFVHGQQNRVAQSAYVTTTMGEGLINDTAYSTIFGYFNKSDHTFGENVINFETLTEHAYLGSDGNVVEFSSSDLAVTDFIDINKIDTIKLTGYGAAIPSNPGSTTQPAVAWAYYDENKQLIGSVIFQYGNAQGFFEQQYDIYGSLPFIEDYGTKKYIRFCAVMSEAESNLASVQLGGQLHIFSIGNGNSTKRSNILEVAANQMNVNGDIKINNVAIPTPYTTMPTITADMLGKIAMYVGATGNGYTQGYFYIASTDGAAEPTYSWVKIGGGRTETVLWENDGTTNPQTITLNEAYSNFDEIVLVSYNQDSQTAPGAFFCQPYLTTEIIIGKRVIACYFGTVYLSYIVDDSTTLSLSLHAGGYIFHKIIGIKYSSEGGNGQCNDDYTTAERKIGKWIDGSDLYQRTFEVTGLVNGQWNNTALGTSDIDIKDFDGYIRYLYNGEFNANIQLNYYTASGDYVATQNVGSDLSIKPNRIESGLTIDKAVITIKYTKTSEQANTQQTDEMR